MGLYNRAAAADVMASRGRCSKAGSNGQTGPSFPLESLQPHLVALGHPVRQEKVAGARQKPCWVSSVSTWHPCGEGHTTHAW